MFLVRIGVGSEGASRRFPPARALEENRNYRRGKKKLSLPIGV
jgi:hypothetical protein